MCKKLRGSTQLNKCITILGAGFIGKNLIQRLINSQYRVKVLSRSGCPKHFKNTGISWSVGDISRGEDVRQAVTTADVVIHLVSNSVPGDRIDVSDELFENVSSTLKLLKICSECNVNRFIFASSSSVYGDQEIIPTSERSALYPTSTHAIQKVTLEYYLDLYAKQYGINLNIFRISNPYGPGQDISGRQGFIAIVLGKALAGKPITVNGDGSAVRDFIYIDDLVDFFELAVCDRIQPNIVNIGSGCGNTINEVIGMLSEILQTDLPVIYSNPRTSDIHKSVLDISLLTSQTGKIDFVSLDDGIRLFYEYVNNTNAI